MSAQVSTPQLIVKPLQYVEETVEGTTPDSAAFVNAGVVSSFNLSIDGALQDISQIGPEDLAAIINGTFTYDFTVEFTMLSSTFLKYAINAANPATPAGTISKSLSLLLSTRLNGTENFIVIKGARAKSATVTMEINAPVRATIEFTSMSVSTPATAHGLTTPTITSTFLTGEVWDWLSGGASPLTVGGSPVTANRIAISVSRNTSVIHVLGNQNPYGTAPHGRRISGDMTVLWLNTTHEAAFKAGTSQTVALVIKTATSTITLSNAKFTTYGRDFGADDTEPVIEALGFRATAITVS